MGSGGRKKTCSTLQKKGGTVMDAALFLEVDVPDTPHWRITYFAASAAGGRDRILLTGSMLMIKFNRYMTNSSSSTHHQGKIMPSSREGMEPMNRITPLVINTAGSTVYEVTRNISSR